jgi:hypothetical protein
MGRLKIILPLRYALTGDVERNTSRYMDSTTGKAKTAFVGQGNRGNWGFKLFL